MQAVHPNIKQIAKSFWEDAVVTPHYPIGITLLEQAICLSKNLTVVKLSKLTAAKIADWFYQKQVNIELQNDNGRLLYGYLYAHHGAGFTFLNGFEPPEEQCFTLAHELAHFILDYEVPRQRAVRTHGESILEVLDGLRPPTIQEQLSGILTGISVKPLSHLLDTPASGGFQRLKIWKVEDRADQLGLEILAPIQSIAGDVRKHQVSRRFDDMKEFIEEILAKKYGLPATVIPPYANHLAHSFTGGRTLADQWGIKF